MQCYPLHLYLHAIIIHMETTPQSLLISHVIVSYSDNNHHNHYGMQNTIDWVAYKQQKFISHILQARKFKVKVLAGLVVSRRRTVSQISDSHLCIVSLHGRKLKRDICDLFIKAIVPDISILMTKSPPKGPIPIFTLSISFQHMNFGRDTAFSLQ